MRVVFTKKIEDKSISKILGSDFIYDVLDVVRGHRIDVNPFDLESRSLIFTSVRGVKYFFENGFLSAGRNKIYAVGKTTEVELLHHGYECVKVARYADELADFIVKNAAQESFLHFCGDLALDTLEKKLVFNHVSYRREVVYHTELIFPVVAHEYDAVVFFSPSGVRSFAEHNTLEGKMLFSIGETTTGELRKYTDSMVHTGVENNLDGLLKRIREVVSR